MKKIASAFLAGLLGISPGIFAQNPQKYKLSILEDASTVKRVKGGRVSSQVVVKVTDENDRPMPAIAVIFTIPQGGGGASFASGGLTASVTTNSIGVASSGSFTATTTSTFSMSVTASTPAGPLTVSVPVNMSAAAASSSASSAAGGSGGSSHTGLIVGVLAGVGAVGAIAAKVLANGKNNNPTPTPQPSTVTGQIGAAGGGTFNPH